MYVHVNQIYHLDDYFSAWYLNHVLNGLLLNLYIKSCFCMLLSGILMNMLLFKSSVVLIRLCWLEHVVLIKLYASTVSVEYSCTKQIGVVNLWISEARWFSVVFRGEVTVCHQDQDVVGESLNQKVGRGEFWMVEPFFYLAGTKKTHSYILLIAEASLCYQKMEYTCVLIVWGVHFRYGRGTCGSQRDFEGSGGSAG